MIAYNQFLKKHLSYFFWLLVISLPILIYDINDYEEYNQGFYSIKYLYSNFINFFSNYDNKLGLGAIMPIGQGLFFYPTSIFAFSYKLFILSTFILNIFIQYYFFLRISKLLGISNKYKYNFFVNAILVICLANFVYNYIDDWISLHTLYSIFFAKLFYLIKFKFRKKTNSLNKLTIFFLIGFLNGHLAYVFFSTIFLLLIVIFNISNFKFNVKILIIPFLICLVICVPNIFNFIDIYSTYPDLKIPKPIYEDITKSLWYPINFFFRICDYFFNLNLTNNYTYFHSKILGYGPQLIFGFFFSLILLFKKKSKFIFNLDKIYILSFIILIFINSLPIGNYAIFLRDYMNIIFLFIFVLILNKNIYLSFSNICLALFFISNLMMLVESFRFLKTNDVSYNLNNLQKKYSNELKNYLNSISKDKRFFRIYLSEKVFKDINNRRNLYYKKNDIYTPKDFTKYKLAVLNVHLKNNPNNNIRKPKLKLHDQLFPLNNEIENKFLMNFYQIKYLFIYEKELLKINLSNFKKIKKFNFDDKSLIIFENQNFGNQYTLSNLNNLKSCQEYSLVDCLVKDKNKFNVNNKIHINKISDNKIEVINLNNNDVNIVLPFIDYHNQKYNENLLYKKFKIKNIKKNNQVIVNYSSNSFIFIKIAVILSLMYLTYISYIRKQKKFKNT